ncbi:hypothetical protein [Streptomyces sp. NPDC002343]
MIRPRPHDGALELRRGRHRAGDPAEYPASAGSPADIDDAGVVAGDLWSGNPARENRLAVRWAADGTPTLLGTAPGDPYSAATLVNNSGTLAGGSIKTPLATYPAGSHHAVVWRS